MTAAAMFASTRHAIVMTGHDELGCITP